ncbi:MAG: signal peptidase I, partial [Clostridiales Family XIII bacterium]|nr:signal peptidase I [Clostridiales Family XIII bacterium]
EGTTAGEMDEVIVPAGNLFLMGDNRQNSTDSRTAEVGFVPEAELIGKAVFRLFPIGNIGFIK